MGNPDGRGVAPLAPPRGGESHAALQDTPRSADTIGKLLERDFLRARLVVALALRLDADWRVVFNRGAGNLRCKRIHDVDLLYGAHSRGGLDIP